MTILRGAVRVARKPPEVLILDASRDLRRPIGHGADAVLLVVDGVLMLFNKLTRGGYRFLFVLYGKRGTGKSFHASCIANAVIERGFSCLVTDIKQVVNLMESSFEKRSGNLERILAPDLLILEDLGAQRSTEYVMEHVYDVIDGRYKAGKPMVITTNFDFRERILNATADDPWGRVFDRIVEVGFPVKYDGNSRRREIGMKNRKDFKRKLGIEGIES